MSWLPTDLWQQMPKQICSQVGGLSLFRVGVDGDGACFFHSIASMMNTENYRKADRALRKEIVARMRGKIADRTKDSHIAAEIMDYENWANESMIADLQKTFKVNFVFWCLETNEVQSQVPVLDVEQYPTMMFAWVERSHFEPVYACIGESQGFRVMQGVFEPKDPNVPVLKAVQDKINADEFADVVVE